MGKYNFLRALGRINDEIKTCDRRLAQHVESYAGNIRSYLGMDLISYEKNKAMFVQAGSLVSAGVCFVPVLGPMLSSALSGLVNSAFIGEKGLKGVGLPFLSAIAASVRYNALLMSGQSAESQFNLGRWFTSGMTNVDNLLSERANPWSDGTMMLVSGLSNMVLSGLTVGCFLGGQNSTIPEIKSTAKLMAPATDEIVEIAFSKHEETLRESMAWLNENVDRPRLLYLVFYEIVKGMNVGGRGNLMLATGKAQRTPEVNPDALKGGDIDEEDYMRIRLKSVTDIKTELRSLVRGKYFYKRGSRLQETFDKFREPVGYYTWFPDPAQAQPPNNNPKAQEDREHLISSICLSKAKLIAYANDYIDQMKGMFGKNFAGQVNTPGLPNAFKTSGHTWKNEYSTAIGSNYDQSEYKKHYVLGAYAFHATLLHHLGTYNLSTVPPFGTSPSLDEAVRKALIDALLTQWWVCSYAYKSGSGKDLRDDVKCYEACMFSADQILGMPYIKPYFDPQKAWKSMARDQEIFNEALRRLKEKIASELNDEIKGDQYLSSKPLASQNVDFDGYLQKIDDLIDVVNIDKAQAVAAQQQNPQVQPRLSTYDRSLNVLETMKLRLQHPDTIGDAATIDKLKEELKEYASYNFNNFIIKTDFLLSLLPTNKRARDGLRNYIFDTVLKGLYQNDNFYADALNIYLAAKQQQQQQKGFQYKRQTENRYADFQGKSSSGVTLKTKDELTDHYNRILTAGNAQNPASVLSRMALDIKEKIRDSLVRLDMSTKLSAAGSPDFNQADFNREVLKVLTLLIKELGS